MIYTKSGYYFETIQVGDSRKYHGGNNQIKSAAYMYAKRNGIKFSCKREGLLTIVTRIK